MALGTDSALDRGDWSECGDGNIGTGAHFGRLCGACGRKAAPARVGWAGAGLLEAVGAALGEKETVWVTCLISACTFNEGKSEVQPRNLKLLALSKLKLLKSSAGN